jgi:hypothetical protein
MLRWSSSFGHRKYLRSRVIRLGMADEGRYTIYYPFEKVRLCEDVWSRGSGLGLDSRRE